MATVAKMGNREYLMSYELCGRPGCPVHVKTSKDGVTWDAPSVGNPVITSDALYGGSSPYTVWDSSTKQLVLSCHFVYFVDTGLEARARSVPRPSSPTRTLALPAIPITAQICSRFPTVSFDIPAPSSQGSTGLFSERTGAAPIGVLPYQADFKANGQLGWIDIGGNWSVSGDEYGFDSVEDIDALAVTGSSGWNDYEVSADVMISDTSGVVGLLARAIWLQSILSLATSRESHAMLVLQSEAYPGGITGSKWYHLSLAVKSYEITATVTGEAGGSVVTYTTIDNSYPQGMTGLIGTSGD
ncbi:hypothetical protein V1509DRAFT_609406 [Lipomyces kononenkoae]